MPFVFAAVGPGVNAFGRGEQPERFFHRARLGAIGLALHGFEQRARLGEPRAPGGGHRQRACISRPGTEPPQDRL
ncbi:MAG: hypothetical protein DYH12_19900, partial [Sorangiineae bacterium PRO1]|nr:hypothetical protein [Sorangiineae bacterium PRO1]